MKKVVISSLVSMFTLFALANCTGATSKIASPEAHTGYVEKKNLAHEEVSKLIVEAAEKAGWKMTEFKSNAFIAEKIDGKDSVATTVTFGHGSFDIAPENSELEDIVSDALN